MKVLLIVTVVLAIVCTTTWAMDYDDCDVICESDYAECNNNTCVCIEGYTGNGTYCYDIDECEYYGSTSYCSDYAYCYNTDGSYYCGCIEGYTGYDGNCTDIDECEYYGSTSYCSDYAYCYNTDGSYYCECIEGYTGYDGNCTELCDEPCGYNAYCYNGSCFCDYGYTGDPYYNCTAFEGVYQVPAVILEGCDPNKNYDVRQNITDWVQEFLQERLDMYYGDV